MIPTSSPNGFGQGPWIDRAGYRQPGFHEEWQRRRNNEFNYHQAALASREPINAKPAPPREPGWGDFLQGATPAWVKAMLALLGGVFGLGLALSQELPPAAGAVSGAIAAMLAAVLPKALGNLFQALVKLAAIAAVLGGIGVLVLVLG